MKLKQVDLPKFRKKLLKEQRGLCRLCSKPVKDPVLDHCHDTGYCRAVLCRLHNSLEGKIHNWIKRYGQGMDRVELLESLIKYWQEDYSNMPLHPKHKTKADKEITQLRRRIRNAKRETTKQRLRARIQELKRSS